MESEDYLDQNLKDRVEEHIEEHYNDGDEENLVNSPKKRGKYFQYLHRRRHAKRDCRSSRKEYEHLQYRKEVSNS